MSEFDIGSILVPFMMLLRCLVPIGILLGISYILRKLGLVVIETSVDPNEEEEEKADEK